MNPLRKGMFVRHPEGVAIVNAIDSSGAVELHFVDALGLTIGQSVVSGPGLAQVSQARLADIPAPRRPAPAVGARFGYV